jgi:hypothetical protein
MTKKELKEIINAHLQWIKSGGEEGRRADPPYEDLALGAALFIVGSYYGGCSNEPGHQGPAAETRPGLDRRGTAPDNEAGADGKEVAR